LVERVTRQLANGEPAQLVILGQQLFDADQVGAAIVLDILRPRRWRRRALGIGEPSDRTFAIARQVTVSRMWRLPCPLAYFFPLLRPA
jgi:hypothetical protein